MKTNNIQSKASDCLLNGIEGVKPIHVGYNLFSNFQGATTTADERVICPAVSNRPLRYSRRRKAMQRRKGLNFLNKLILCHSPRMGIFIPFCQGTIVALCAFVIRFRIPS